MAAFSSLKNVFRNPRNLSKPITLLSSLSSFHSSATSSSVPLLPPLPHLSIFPPLFPPSFRTSFFSPSRTRWIPFSGPLFLSSPPWKLLQSATPLYLRGEILLRKPHAFNLNLLPKSRFPIKLGFGSVRQMQDAVVAVDGTHFQNFGGGVISLRRAAVEEGFFNLPNLISMSRLVSGPILGW